MLKQLFLDYQKDVTNDFKFSKLASALEIKMLTIFKTIHCNANYKDDFIQECYIKIFDVVRKKQFEERELNDKILNVYFERAFLTVRQQFIKKYHLYRNHISLDMKDENGIKKIDMLVDKNTLPNSEFFLDKFKEIREVLSIKDYDFLMMFINKEEKALRRITEVAKLLNVSRQAVSKRFHKIRKMLREIID